MPAQKPGRSQQIVVTPEEFMIPVSERFGLVDIDLAANIENKKALKFFGPGSMWWTDALDDGCRWDPDYNDGLCWLNPPFGNIAPWAAKCVRESENGARIAMLVPASVGANWFNNYVRPYAYVLELTPRLTFVGHKSAYPKDLILAVYTPERFVGREAWEWKTKHVLDVGPANDNASGVDPRQMTLPILEAATG